jgi:hypothetical protein
LTPTAVWHLLLITVLKHFYTLKALMGIVLNDVGGHAQCHQTSFTCTSIQQQQQQQQTTTTKHVSPKQVGVG